MTVYKIAKGYTSLTIWFGNKHTNELLMTDRIIPLKSLSRFERFMFLRERLNRCGLGETLVYEPTLNEKDPYK